MIRSCSSWNTGYVCLKSSSNTYVMPSSVLFDDWISRSVLSKASRPDLWAIVHLSPTFSTQLVYTLANCEFLFYIKNWGLTQICEGIYKTPPIVVLLHQKYDRKIIINIIQQVHIYINCCGCYIYLSTHIINCASHDNLKITHSLQVYLFIVRPIIYILYTYYLYFVIFVYTTASKIDCFFLYRAIVRKGQRRNKMLIICTNMYVYYSLICNDSGGRRMNVWKFQYLL